MSTLIWICGGMSSGKSTTCRNLLETLGDKDNKKLMSGEFDGVKYFYTKYGSDVCCLGDLNDSQCSGWDRVSSACKTEGLELSMKKAKKECSLVFIESIMSSSKWPEIFFRNFERTIIVHLDIDFETNVIRLKGRKAKKANFDGDFMHYPLTNDNYEFIRKERMQYTNIFEKFKDKFSAALTVKTDTLTPSQVNSKVIKFISNNI